MKNLNLTPFSKILAGIGYQLNIKRSVIYFRKTVKFYSYKGFFDVNSYKLEVKITCTEPSLNCTKELLFNLARKEEKLINSDFLKYFVENHKNNKVFTSISVSQFSEVS